ncbi:MAG: flagellar biosynthetic protein FliR [Parvularcula sp.]|nr:flagellar biosynthetic protein FliR [Parvularcula sp.]
MSPSEILRLAESLGFSEGYVTAFVAGGLRLGFLLLLMPGLGDILVPVRTRIAFVMVLTLVMMPMVGPLVVEGPFALTSLLIGEALIGFTLGIGVKLLASSLQMAGTLIAHALSLNQIFGVAQDAENINLLGSLLGYAGAVLFLVTGLPIEMFAALVESLTAVPVGAGLTLDRAELLDFGLQLVRESFRLGAGLAVPFLVMNTAFYLVLGIINRAMPQLMVTFIGLPGITLAGLFLLLLMIGPILVVWMRTVIGGLP